MNCYCGSKVSYDQCCEPFIKGTSFPATAEQLMRSRYSAYVVAEVDYLFESLAPESRSDFDAKDTKKWATSVKWEGLQIISTKKGQTSDVTGVVEFMAIYNDGKESLEHHEVSDFRKDKKDGRWYFVDGHAHTHKAGEGHQHHHEKPQTVVRQEPKVGRNDPCTCGSGKKYKKCCGVND